MASHPLQCHLLDGSQGKTHTFAKQISPHSSYIQSPFPASHGQLFHHKTSPAAISNHHQHDLANSADNRDRWRTYHCQKPMQVTRGSAKYRDSFVINLTAFTQQLLTKNQTTSPAA